MSVQCSFCVAHPGRQDPPSCVNVEPSRCRGKDDVLFVQCVARFVCDSVVLSVTDRLLIIATHARTCLTCMVIPFRWPWLKSCPQERVNRTPVHVCAGTILQHGSGAGIATTEQITETANKLQHLQMEQAVMNDLFNHAVRSFPSHSGDSKLNFRQAERHMPKAFSGKSGRYVDFVFWWKRTEVHWTHRRKEVVFRGWEPKDMNEIELKALECTSWNVFVRNGGAVIE